MTNRKYPFILSKSTYISGKQCEKRLYLSKKHRNLATAPSSSQEARMAQGTTVGELARDLYPSGKDASPENYWNYDWSIDQTKTWIAEGESTIYEAAFYANEVMAALDILHHQNGERWAIEVKSSRNLKSYHLDDAALQYWVMSQSGFAPDRFFIMHLSKTYVKNGDIDLEQLFHLEEVTDSILERQIDISEKINSLKAMLRKNSIPDVAIGKHCSSPFDCEFKAHCWQHIPKPSIFDITNIRNRAWEYHNRGILKIEDIPEEDQFSHYQSLQINGIKKGAIHFDTKEIRDFFSNWKYPLYFFDFETINPAVPLYDHSGTYDQQAVQYSLHVKYKRKKELLHTDFLTENNSDSRQKLIEQMLNDLGKVGSIVAYNMSFETDVIKKLAFAFPKYHDDLMALIERFVDLRIPFQKGWYYLPEMNGSSSIKAVLPAMFPNDPTLDYGALEVSNGQAASTLLQAICEGRLPSDKLTEIRNNLLSYCELDTLAMVKIYKKIKKQLKGGIIFPSMQTSQKSRSISAKEIKDYGVSYLSVDEEHERILSFAVNHNLEMNDINTVDYQSSDKFCIIAMMNYNLDPKDQSLSKFEFALMEWNFPLRAKLQKVKDQGARLGYPCFVALSTAINLYDSIKVHEEKITIEGIRLDSISFHKGFPNVSSLDYIKTNAYIICKEEGWVLVAEHYDENRYPVCMYRSAMFDYPQSV